MKILFAILVSLSTIFLSGCKETPEINDPLSVARLFWAASLSPDPSAAKIYMKDGDNIDIDIVGKSEKDIAILGTINQQEGYYFIDTTLQLVRDNKIVKINLKTVVVHADGKWKVDYWSSTQSVFVATLEASLSSFIDRVDSANQYIGYSFGEGDRDEIITSAEATLDEEFGRAKSVILQNLKRNNTKQIEKQIR